MSGYPSKKQLSIFLAFFLLFICHFCLLAFISSFFSFLRERSLSCVDHEKRLKTANDVVLLE